MQGIVVLVLFTFMAATLVALFLGLGTMVAGERIRTKYSNKLMIARVCLQGLAIMMLGLLFLLK
jgi:phosphate/sulfate permease